MAAQNLKIPNETQSERVFRLRAKGLRNVRSGHQGDLYCKVSVETPVGLNKKQRQLLKEFDELVKKGGERHNPRERGWTSKLKSFFDELVT